MTNAEIIIDGKDRYQRQRRDLLTAADQAPDLNLRLADLPRLTLSLLSRPSTISDLGRLALGVGAASFGASHGQSMVGRISGYMGVLAGLAERHGFSAAFKEWRREFRMGSVSGNGDEAEQLGRGLAAKFVAGIQDRNYKPYELEAIELVVAKVCTAMFYRDIRYFCAID